MIFVFRLGSLENLDDGDCEGDENLETDHQNNSGITMCKCESDGIWAICRSAFMGLGLTLVL